ncbi:MAG: FkbM family methyltransferase [Rhodospirillales bacterium]|nr:FkbM family methyltransferase [Rhodospirillales bacterium]
MESVDRLSLSPAIMRSAARSSARPMSFQNKIFALIRRSPFQPALLARAYKRLLIAWGASYPGTAYFGARFKCDPNDLIQSRILNFGFWEPNVSSTIETILKDGDVFVDVGANIGYDSLLASAAVGSGGSVISIEASPRTFRLLSDHIRENAATNVRAVNLAVADEAGTLTLYCGAADNSGTATTMKSRGFAEEAVVECAPLDHVLTAEERARLRLIKMDIEGGELPVLRRFLDTIDLYPKTVQLIVEASAQDEPQGWSDVFMRMQAAGFRAYLIPNGYDYDFYMNWREASPLEPLAELPPEQCDILFTRQSQEVPGTRSS